MTFFGRHDKHLPERKHLNKTAGHGSGQPADQGRLKEVARAQGTGTKQDAKDARDAKNRSRNR